MPKRKYEEWDFVARVKAIKKAGLKESASPNREIESKEETVPCLEARLDMIFEITERKETNVGNMLFFVMYDISSNKVRNQVVKYLIQKGCTRVQRSIFLADLDTKVYNEIREDLAAVQQAYENEDSILIVPLSTDYLKSMKIIGQNIDIDVITKCKHTLFF